MCCVLFSIRSLPCRCCRHRCRLHWFCVQLKEIWFMSNICFCLSLHSSVIAVSLCPFVRAFQMACPGYAIHFFIYSIPNSRPLLLFVTSFGTRKQCKAANSSTHTNAHGPVNNEWKMTVVKSIYSQLEVLHELIKYLCV